MTAPHFDAIAALLPQSIGSAIPASSAALASLIAMQAVEPGWRVWLATATDVATVIIALALVVTAVVFLGIALTIRKLLRRVDPLVSQVRSHVDPVMRHAQDVGENVNYITSAIRADVQQVTELVDTTRRRLNRTADAAEQRIREFNALLSVMQEEAEQLFIDSASTVRGVRAGTETYRGLSSDGPDGPREAAPRRAARREDTGE